MLAEDTHELYRLDVDLGEPVSRAALCDAAARGWYAERVALDTAQSVEHVLMRASEEGVTLARLWQRAHPKRAQVWAALVAWAGSDDTISDVSRAHGIQIPTLARLLRTLGYEDQVDRGVRSVAEQLRAAGKKRDAQTLRRLRRLVRQMDLEGKPRPFAAEAARALGVGAGKVMRLADQHGITLAAKPARWLKVVDAITEGAKLPAWEREPLTRIARAHGVPYIDCLYACRALDLVWTETMEVRVERVKAYQAAHPEATATELSRGAHIDIASLLRYEREGLVVRTWRKNKTRRSDGPGGALEEPG